MIAYRGVDTRAGSKFACFFMDLCRQFPGWCQHQHGGTDAGVVAAFLKMGESGHEVPQRFPRPCFGDGNNVSSLHSNRPRLRLNRTWRREPGLGELEQRGRKKEKMIWLWWKVCLELPENGDVAHHSSWIAINCTHGPLHRSTSSRAFPTVPSRNSKVPVC